MTQCVREKDALGYTHTQRESARASEREREKEREGGREGGREIGREREREKRERDSLFVEGLHEPSTSLVGLVGERFPFYSSRGS